MTMVTAMHHHLKITAWPRNEGANPDFGPNEGLAHGIAIGLCPASIAPIAECIAMAGARRVFPGVIGAFRSASVSASWADFDRDRRATLARVTLIADCLDIAGTAGLGNIDALNGAGFASNAAIPSGAGLGVDALQNAFVFSGQILAKI
jgi:hypothetical protein